MTKEQSFLFLFFHGGNLKNSDDRDDEDEQVKDIKTTEEEVCFTAR